MRILHLASEYPPQPVFGLGRYVCDLSKALVTQGHAVHVLTNSFGGHGQEVIDAGVAVHRVDFPPPPKPPGNTTPVSAFNLHLQQRAHALGRAGIGNPEVIVSHDWLTALAGDRLARRWGLPHVWTVHDTVVGKRFGHLEEPDDRLVAAIERWAGGHADLIAVNSRTIRDEVEQQYGAQSQRVRLLHCGVDPERSTSRQGERRLRAFRAVFASQAEVLVTYVGRLDLEKGIDTLIEAFAACRAESLPLRLVIAGNGVLEPQIREHLQARGLGDVVHLPGYLGGEVLTALYAISDLHVCPSYYEPFGLVAVEAMAAGAPVIASDTGGLREIISKRDVGILVPPRDVAALTAAIRSLATDRRRRVRLGSAGAKHVRRHFAWSVIARGAATLYAEAVTQSTPAAMAGAA